MTRTAYYDVVILKNCLLLKNKTNNYNNCKNCKKKQKYFTKNIIDFSCTNNKK